MATVSILIPAYNAQHWIAATIESALRQTWPRTEIIVVDDGSTDDTLVVARSFEPRGVKVIRQENRGPGPARNLAFAGSQGDFIQYIDADDLLSADKIEEQVKILQASPPRVVGISEWVYFYDGADPQRGLAHHGWPVVDTDDPLSWLIELLGPEGSFGMVPLGAWLTPRSVIEDAGPWDSVNSPDADGEYFARVVLASAGLRRSSRGQYYYRKFPKGGSLSSTRSEQLAWYNLRSTDLKAQYLLARTDKPRAKRALANAYMHHAFASYPYFVDITRVALERVAELGGTDYVPPFGTWRGQVLSRIVGWKATKRLNVWYHGLRKQW
jgi:glycosyltransferase involved in cell wall biosynthesis